MVYELLKAKGLTSYYNIAERMGAHLLPITGDTSEAIVLPHHTGDAITFHLDGIQCASCVWLLERLPVLCAGVIQARVRLTHGDISVRYDSARVSAEEIARTIRTLGYSIYTPRQDECERRKGDRESLAQIAIAGACAMNIMMLAVSLYQGLFTGIDQKYETLFRWISLALAVPVVGYCALPIYKKGIGALRSGALHIDLPITIGILLSFLLSALNTVLGSGEIYFDSITTIVFLLLSTRYLQRRAFETARRKCTSRWSLLPSTIREVLPSGEEREIPSAELRAGMIVSVKPGERVPCDGTIELGTSSLDCSTITGESLPNHAHAGTAVLAGSLNIEAPLRIRSTHQAGTSRLDKIIASVTSSLDRPPTFVTALDTFSMLFTASALLLAAGAFLFALPDGLQLAASAAIAMLTVTCPCAVALALPLLSIRALSAAAERQLLVKTPDVFENLPKVSEIFFDKTGTLTTGELVVMSCTHYGSLSKESIEEFVYHLTSVDPQHPVSRALRRWLPTAFTPHGRCGKSKRIPGKGVSANCSHAPDAPARLALLTSLAHAQSEDIFAPALSYECQDASSVVVLTISASEGAIFELCDTVRPEASHIVRELASRHTVSILSGDRQQVTAHVAGLLDIDAQRARGALLPEDKAAIIAATSGSTMFAGDGANDAPALRAATVGVALRGGIQSILESAHVFITRGGIENLPTLTLIAQRYRLVARGLVSLGLFYNAVGIILAFMGFISPLLAAIAMPIFSSILLMISYNAFIGLSHGEQR